MAGIVDRQVSEQLQPGAVRPVKVVKDAQAAERTAAQGEQ